METLKGLIHPHLMSLGFAFVSGLLILPLMALAYRLHREELASGEPSTRQLVAYFVFFSAFGLAAFSPWSPLELRIFALTFESISLGMLASYYLLNWIFGKR